jgi:hypothetical protein
MKNKLFPLHHSFLLPQERQQQDGLHIALLNVSAHRHLLIFSCRREIEFSVLDDMLNRLGCCMQPTRLHTAYRSTTHPCKSAGTLPRALVLTELSILEPVNVPVLGVYTCLNTSFAYWAGFVHRSL